MVDTKDSREIALAEPRALVATDDALAPQASVGQRPRWGLPGPHRARHMLRRGLLVLIYAPAAALLLIGVAAAVGLLGDLWRLARAFDTHALDTVPTTYDRLALAGRVALVSGAFLALLCALIVVAVGCRGRRWWHLYLIPGVPLSAVAALLFIVAVAWCAAAVNQRLGWSPTVWETLSVLALADAVVVAARIGGIGAGPLGTRRARLRRRWSRESLADRITGRPAARQTRPLPVVRFGPRVTGIPASDLLAVPTADPATISGAPTAEELRAAAAAVVVASGPQDAVLPVAERESGAA